MASPALTLLSRVLVPLASGALGASIVLAFASRGDGPAPPVAVGRDGCAEVAAEVAALRQTLESARERRGATFVDGGVLEAKLVVERAFAELENRREERAVHRADFEARHQEERRAQAELELVKLRATQRSISLEQTKANVLRRLKGLGLSDAELGPAAEAGAAYVRQRSEALIGLVERESNGAKVTMQEVDLQLTPIDQSLARSLPATLDDSTRGAVVTELGAMVRVPFFFRF